MLRKVLIGLLCLITAPITALAGDQTTNRGPKEGKYMCTTDRAAAIAPWATFLGLSGLNQNQLRFSITLRKAVYYDRDECFSNDTIKWLKEYQPPPAGKSEDASIDEALQQYAKCLKAPETPGCGPWEDPSGFISRCLSNFTVDSPVLFMELDSIDGSHFFDKWGDSLDFNGSYFSLYQKDRAYVAFGRCNFGDSAPAPSSATLSATPSANPGPGQSQGTVGASSPPADSSGTSGGTTHPYDDCILKYMGGAQNKEAVYAIERSCIDKNSLRIVEKPIVRSAYAGNYNNGFGSIVKGLVISIFNNTKFDITEITITARNKRDGSLHEYPVTLFNAPLPGFFYTDLGEPGLLNTIKENSLRTFLVEMNDVNIPMDKFADYYDWDLTATRGIPD
jgi:hypothetical protein